MGLFKDPFQTQGSTMQLPASRFAILVAVVIGSAPLTLDAQLIRINKISLPMQLEHVTNKC